MKPAIPRKIRRALETIASHRMLTTLVVLILTILAALPAWAQTGGDPRGEIVRIPLGPVTSLTLLDDQPDAMRYRMELGELQALRVNTTEGEFARLFIPGFHSSHGVGAPELPMMNRLIEIPYGATARVEVLSRTTTDVDLAAHGITTPLFPAQPSMPKSADPATWPFVLDRSTYEVSRVAGETAAVEDLGRLRAVRIGRLELSPVEYLPAENRLVVTTEMEIVVHFDDADHAAGADLRARTESPFFDAIYGRIEGYRSTHDDHPNPVEPVVTMVVVTWPDYTEQLGEFVQWKTERGFRTILASLGDPGVGWTKETVQAYLRDLYLDATPEAPAPSFVVFVGDIDEMPTWTVGGDASDRPYCDIEGDLCPDILYGRLSVTNAAELDAVLEKTLMYDRFTMPDPSYMGEVVMIAGMDGTFGPTHGNGQINYGTDLYFNAAHGIYSYTYLYPQSGSHAGDIVQHVSDGVGYINYTAHGSQTSWADPAFTQSQVRNLQNDGEYCLAVANCCLTSSYEVPECFAETWLRVADKGAIGYIGGSNSTYWDEDYWWGVGYRSTISAHPTYEDTGLGAYDGLFHDHGEGMENWYVTNDAIIFCGNLAVMESGSGLTTYYWNIYNLMGDPSLCTYLGVPPENPVVHPSTLFTTWTSVPIEAVPGSYVGLSQNGALLAAGTVGMSGALDLDLWGTLAPGPVRLVVMAQNREPYIEDLNAIIPAQVYMDPHAIPCETEVEISVGVFEYDGVTPKPGIEVWAQGFLTESAHAFTGADGYCTLLVRSDYGPSVDIVGQEPGQPYELFREALEVQAQVLIGANITATTEIGLFNQAPLHLPTTLHAYTSQPGYTLHALLNDAWLGSTTNPTYEVTATELGTLEGVIAVVGFDLVRRSFPVVEVHGTLTGYVDANGAPGAGAAIRGYQGDELVFQASAGADGRYTVGEEIVCGPYRMEVSLFGYLMWENPVFVDFGANTIDVPLAPAPAGLLGGRVTEVGSGAPLAAMVDIYRSDNGELYRSTESDPLDGSYVVASLPYFEYMARVRADRHIPVETPVVIDGPDVVLDFEMERTLANLLVLDDNSGAPRPGGAEFFGDARVDGVVPAPEGGGSWDRSKEPLPAGGTVLDGVRDPLAADGALAGKASADLEADLVDLGYFVTMETVAATQPADWVNYDLVVVSSGNNETTLSSSTFRAALRTFVLNGGRLLIEGGEVGYDHYADSNFARDVLHINDWNHDASGNVTIATPSHPVASEPNALPSPISCGYSVWGDQDAVVATSNAVRVGSWSSYPSDASLIAFDPGTGQDGEGRIVYYAFNYSALDGAARPLLLENTIAWLLPEDPASAPEDTSTPVALRLRPVHPNPASGAAGITFDLPASGAVDLAIYDVHGRRVATLVDGVLPAGTHELFWTGRDADERLVASGVYFARLAVEGAVQLQKVTRIR